MASRYTHLLDNLGFLTKHCVYEMSHVNPCNSSSFTLICCIGSIAWIKTIIYPFCSWALKSLKFFTLTNKVAMGVLVKSPSAHVLASLPRTGVHGTQRRPGFNFPGCCQLALPEGSGSRGESSHLSISLQTHRVVRLFTFW